MDHRRLLGTMASLTLCLYVLAFPCAAEDVKTKSAPISTVKTVKSAQLKVEGDTLTVVKALPFRVRAPEGADLYDWTVPESVKAFPEDNTLTVTSAPKGTFVVRVRCTTIDFEKKKINKELGEVEINYGGVIPGPQPPTPPNPDPPTPQPKNAPIAIDGFSVLMVTETRDGTELPKGQFNVAFGGKVRDYLKANCVREGPNNWPAYRIYDQNISMEGETKAWQDAMKRERKSVPWIVVSDGKTGYEGPLPASEEEAINLFKKYGGK